MDSQLKEKGVTSPGPSIFIYMCIYRYIQIYEYMYMNIYSIPLHSKTFSDVMNIVFFHLFLVFMFSFLNEMLGISRAKEVFGLPLPTPNSIFQAPDLGLCTYIYI